LQTNPALQASQAYMTGMDGYQEQVDQVENTEDMQFGIDEATMMVDGALGAGMSGQVINSLTPQIQKNIIPKTGQFLAKQVAPRLLAGTAMTSLGPFGTALGLAAPDLAVEGAEFINDLGPRRGSSNLPESPDRMTQIVQQNPELSGTPDVLINAMQGPGVGYNALNVR